MNRRHLRYFTEIAASGGFTAASRQLNVSQPALLYQMNELESLLNVALFHRHPRGVDLTPAGRTFLPLAQQLLAQYEQIERAAVPFRETPADMLHLGFAPTAARVLAPQAIAALTARRPTRRITMRQALSGALIRDILKGELDCAFCYDLADTGVEFTHLFKEDLYLIGPPGKVRTDEGDIAFRELAGYKLSLVTDHLDTRNMIRQISEREKVSLSISLESNIVEINRNIIDYIDIATIAPIGLYMESVNEGKLGYRRIVAPEIVFKGGVVFRSGLANAIKTDLTAVLSREVTALISEDRIGWMEMP